MTNKSDLAKQALDMMGELVQRPPYDRLNREELERLGDDALHQCLAAYDESRCGPWLEFAQNWLINVFRTALKDPTKAAPVVYRPADDLPTPEAVRERVRQLRAAMLGSIRPGDVADVMERALYEAKGGKVDAMRFYLGMAQAQIDIALPDARQLPETPQGGLRVV